MKVIISGGGTGGHIFPAVAIANEIKERFPDADILFVGALGKMEMEKVPKAGYKIVGLPIAGFNRSNLLANIGLPFKVLKSMYKAYKTISDFKPDFVVGVGGFASGPTLRMANFLKIKTFIQEQNSYAGITNKFLAKKASKICVAYPDMDKFFPKEKIVVTGNPVRKDIANSTIQKEEARLTFSLRKDMPTLLVIGGSLGAKSINEGIKKHLDSILSLGIQLIWQTGKPYFETAQQITSGKTGVFVSDFIYTMPEAYAAADFVVSRAGALSVSEICVVGKASILVPYPHAAEDHQTQNALSLTTKNAAILVKDSEVETGIFEEIKKLSQSAEMRDSISNNVRGFAKPYAAKEIVDTIIKAL
ncbi:MAG: undecaprenyldiphospho-muramoylpentapeptide beta-N-acetylglucosaminyltransferase [Leadbetterella sp.]